MSVHIRVASLVGTLVSTGFSSVSLAEEQHGQEATQHLEQTVESGKKGAVEEAGKHTEEAKQHTIQQNKTKPYRKSPKKISGENPKQEHDEQAFGSMEKAEGHAAKGHAQEAGESASKAEKHLQEKDQVQ